MKSRLAVTAAIAVVALTGQMLLPTSPLAQGRADHSLFFTGSDPADTHLVCGAVQPNQTYTLHVSGTASGSAGQFIIVFRDTDQMGFDVPAGSTYSTTQALGGVAGVDSPSVMISQTGGVQSMMASVRAEGAGLVFCTNCTGGVTGGTTGTAGAGDSRVCNFP